MNKHKSECKSNEINANQALITMPLLALWVLNNTILFYSCPSWNYMGIHWIILVDFTGKSYLKELFGNFSYNVNMIWMTLLDKMLFNSVYGFLVGQIKFTWDPKPYFHVECHFYKWTIISMETIDVSEVLLLFFWVLIFIYFTL